MMMMMVRGICDNDDGGDGDAERAGLPWEGVVIYIL